MTTRNSRSFLRLFGCLDRPFFGRSVLVCAALLTILRPSVVPAAEPPNIVLIVADDLGYGELGCYGQRKIQTPRIDRLAAEGMRFTQFYAGSCVCAPSRSTLMTGLHTGHTPVRANGGGRSLADRDVTIAEVLKQAGYATGGFGKWGLGIEGSPGHPNRQGFDEYFGFYHQVHAHFHFPYYVWQNETKYPLPKNEDHRRGQYAPDEIQAQALKFIRQNQGRRFFCYIPCTLPHVELVVPEDSVRPYRGQFPEEPLPDPRPGYIGSDEPYATFAGMVSRLDRYVGQVVDLVDELGLRENTIILFTSDNGGQGGAWTRMTDFFDGNAPLRGYKGQFYEGGIRVPLVARWPGKIEPGAVSDQVGAFWDFLPTFADLAGVEPPANHDGISLAPTLLGQDKLPSRDWFYWEYPFPNGLVQAARLGDWKVVQPRSGAPQELYNLGEDPSETTNLASRRPEILARMKDRLAQSRTEERSFPPEEHTPGVLDYVR